MGDYFPGKIQIGGKLHLKAPADKKQEDWDDLIARFIQKINDTSFDFGENKYNAVTSRDLVHHLEPNTGMLVCCDSEARMGEFEDLEEVCQELGLSYDRWSDGYYEYNAVYSKWRPGFKRPFECEADKSEHEVCDRKPVLQAYLLALNGANPRSIADALHCVLYTVPGFDAEPPDLEPFEVVE
jgi:hypothetical protein